MWMNISTFVSSHLSKRHCRTSWRPNHFIKSWRKTVKWEECGLCPVECVQCSTLSLSLQSALREENFHYESGFFFFFAAFAAVVKEPFHHWHKRFAGPLSDAYLHYGDTAHDHDEAWLSSWEMSLLPSTRWPFNEKEPDSSLSRSLVEA